MGVAAARPSAEPVPPSMGMEKTEAKMMSAAYEIDPRLVQPSVVATKSSTRATNLPGEEERPSIFIRDSCERKIVKRDRGEREPTQGSMFSAGHEPTQDSAFGESFESTQSCAFSVGHEPIQDNAFSEGASQPKPTSRIGEAGARSPRVRRR